MSTFFWWYLNELKSRMKWWKLLVFIVVTAALVVSGSKDLNRTLGTYWTFYFTAFICKFLTPRMDKIEFLLPRDQNGRKTYIIASSVMALLFIILWHIGIRVLGVVFDFFSIGEAVLIFFCRDILLLTMVIAFNIAEYYSPMPESTKEGKPVKPKKARKEKRRTICLFLFITYSILHVLLGEYLLQGLWYGISTLLAYTCTLAITYIIIADVSIRNLTYETIRKPVKVF